MSAKAHPGPPVADGEVAEALRRWAAANAGLLLAQLGCPLADAAAALLAADPAGWELLHVRPATDQAATAPRRYLLRAPAELCHTPSGARRAQARRCWVLLHLPDGSVLPANTSFTDPACRFRLAPGVGGRAAPTDHATYLLGALPPGEPLRLYAAVHEEVEWLLRQGELEALGLDAPRQALWQRGRFLFTSPDPRIAGYFAGKPSLLRFGVPRDRLAAALQAGLVNVNLFLADHGETLDASERFGAADIGLEVVALGVDGIRWLLAFLEP
ncbi:MAG: hypothetical protein FJ125_13150 [Deltaproteobacteria bacterium]|nr:hypothetical protein [Deltaproteobacteria bacterium]